MFFHLLIYCQCQWIRGAGINKLTLQLQRGLTWLFDLPQMLISLKSLETSGVRIIRTYGRDTIVLCASFVTFRGATRYKPIGWGGHHPGGIFHVRHNHCTKSASSEGDIIELLVGFLRHAISMNPDPGWQPMCILRLSVHYWPLSQECLLYSVQLLSTQRWQQRVFSIPV